MRILLLGGTVFVGRHFVEAALQDGHEVTLLHRGQRGSDLFPEVDRILADRDGGLDALGDRSWDAVVDCCGYLPRIVRQSAQALAGRISRYLFVSTVSVYKSPTEEGTDETGELGTLEDPTTEEITAETYGPLKVLCEAEVEGAFGDRAFIVRPGLIMGPYDPSNRFTHWAERIGNESPVLAPALLDQPMQLIDARDLGAWMLLGLKNRLSGKYNAAGPDTPKTFGDMLDACHAQNPGSEFVWIKEDDIETHGLKMWQDLPLTLSSHPAEQGMLRMDNRKAIAAGLRFRPWADTARDVLAWVRSPDPKPKPTHGLERSKELEIIAMLGSSA